MRYIERVITLEFDEKLCNGCGMCINVCPHSVFRLENKRAVLADRGACMECGACAKNCEQNAIHVRAGVGCATCVLTSQAGRKSECGCSVNQTPCN